MKAVPASRAAPRRSRISARRTNVGTASFLQHPVMRLDQSLSVGTEILQYKIIEKRR